MTKPFNNSDIKIKIGEEVPNDDINLMYYEKPDLPASDILNISYNLMEESIYNINIQDIINMDIESKVFPDTANTLRDIEDGHIKYVNNEHFYITNTYNDDEQTDPLYFQYSCRYQHLETNESLGANIKIYKEDEIIETGFKITYENVGVNIYDIKIFTNFNNKNATYYISYNPVDIEKYDYKEIINPEPIYTKTDSLSSLLENKNDYSKQLYYINTTQNSKNVMTNISGGISSHADYNYSASIPSYDRFDYNINLTGNILTDNTAIHFTLLVDEGANMSTISPELKTAIEDFIAYVKSDTLVDVTINFIYFNSVYEEGYYPLNTPKFRIFPADGSLINIVNFVSMDPFVHESYRNYYGPLFKASEILYENNTITNNAHNSFIIIGGGATTNEPYDFADIKNQLYNIGYNTISSIEFSQNNPSTKLQTLTEGENGTRYILDAASETLATLKQIYNNIDLTISELQLTSGSSYAYSSSSPFLTITKDNLQNLLLSPATIELNLDTDTPAYIDANLYVDGEGAGSKTIDFPSKTIEYDPTPDVVELDKTTSITGKLTSDPDGAGNRILLRNTDFYIERNDGHKVYGTTDNKGNILIEIEPDEHYSYHKIVVDDFVWTHEDGVFYNLDHILYPNAIDTWSHVGEGTLDGLIVDDIKNAGNVEINILQKMTLGNNPLSEYNNASKYLRKNTFGYQEVIGDTTYIVTEFIFDSSYARNLPFIYQNIWMVAGIQDGSTRKGEQELIGYKDGIEIFNIKTENLDTDFLTLSQGYDFDELKCIARFPKVVDEEINHIRFSMGEDNWVYPGTCIEPYKNKIFIKPKHVDIFA